MSKMSQLHAELSEQAYDLGFMSIEDAEKHGWRVDYEEGKLVAPKVLPTYQELADLEKAQREAHEAWLKEKSHVLTELAQLEIWLAKQDFEFMGKSGAEIVGGAIEFIAKGEA